MEEIAKNESDSGSTFAKRLITGQAAEQYFRDSFADVDLSQGYKLHDTTKFGCGFDFKLLNENSAAYCGVEVKGLSDKSGNVVLTNKEYAVAGFLKERYFLFVVKNFREKPFHHLYQDPIKTLDFTKTEQKIIQTSWGVSV